METRDDTPLSATGANTFAHELELLHTQCRGWLEAYEAWPIRVRALSHWLESAQVEDTAERDLTKRVQQFMSDSFSPITHLNEAVNVANILSPLIEQSKLLPKYRQAGSLYSQLHSQLENVLNQLVQLPGALEVRAGRCLQDVHFAPRHLQHSLIKSCTQVLTAAQTWDVSQLANSLPQLKQLCIVLPYPSLHINRHNSSAPGYERWHILVIEDDPLGQNSIGRVIENLHRRLQPELDIAYDVVADRQSGEKRLKELTARSVGGERKHFPDTGIVAVLDMGLPAKQGEAPSRDEGHELLRFAKQNGVNVPVIVLTTPSNFLADHLIAAGLGVSDYLLKGADSEEKLLQVLMEYVTHRRQRVVRLYPETERIVYIDDVEVRVSYLSECERCFLAWRRFQW